MRSKGKDLFVEDPEKMFQKAIEYVVSMQEEIKNHFPGNILLYGIFEYSKTQCFEL